MPDFISLRCYCDGFQRFLALPRELRDRVYRSVVADLPSRVFISHRTPISQVTILPDTLPNICFTSKQIQEESILIFVQRTRLVFDNLCPQTVRIAIQPLENFIAKFEHGFKSIRMLTFHDIRRYGSIRYPDEVYPAKLVLRCTGLQDLAVDFRIATLLRFTIDDSSGNEEAELSPALLSTAEIEYRWNLQGLFAMAKLRSVRFRCLVAPWQLWRYNVGSLDNIVANLTTTMREGFERNGRSVRWGVEAVLSSG